MGLQVGDHIVYSPESDPNSWQSFAVTTAPVNNTTWFQVAVTRIDQADVVTAPSTNARVNFSVLRYTPTPDSLGGVTDIDTDKLLIPRITPAPEIKTANVLNVALDANVATVTTTGDHGMAAGETIDVASVTLNQFNGQYVITTVPTTTSLTYDKVSANVTTTASTGTVKTVNLPELEADYPDLTEEERTHDGLWVIADGGLLGT